MTNNDDLALKLKAAAEKAISDEGPGWWNERQLSHEAGPIIHQADVKFIAAASPANILALLAERDADKKVISDSVVLFETLRQRIAELEAISAAAEKLVRCKGRYHSEQNYRALASLFGVTTPELPPLETEARTVSVKLRTPGIIKSPIGMHCEVWERAEVESAIAAAGINLEVGE